MLEIRFAGTAKIMLHVCFHQVYVGICFHLENWITILDFHDQLVGIHGSSLACVWPKKQLQAVGVSNRFLGAQQSQMPLRLVWSLLLLLLKKC